MSHYTLAIDPGSSAAGWAMYAGAELIECGYIAQRVGEPLERIVAMSGGFAYQLDGAAPIAPAIVIEWPEIHRGGKARPNDQLVLAGAAGALVLAASRVWSSCCPVRTIKPREWTHGRPKATKGNPWASPRGRMIQRRLASGERLIVGDKPKHDTLDAVGIGLWAVGRFAIVPGGNCEPDARAPVKLS